MGCPDAYDYLNWHADDERELGIDPVIASANFGETRDFVLRRNDDHKTQIKIPLGNGSLLIMRGALQRKCPRDPVARIVRGCSTVARWDRRES